MDSDQKGPEMVSVAALFPQQFPQSLDGRVSPRPLPRTGQAQALSLSITKEGGTPASKSVGSGSDWLASMRATAKENAKKLASLEKAAHDPGKRIAEVQDKLKQLLKRMQRTALMGDKRAAAAIAREASGLAKELAAAIKEAAGDAKSSPVEAGIPADPAVLLNRIATPAVDEGLIREANKALLGLRSVIALAKATIERKESRPGSRKENPQDTKNFQKEADTAEAELEKAAASIQAETSPPTATPPIGLTPNFAAEA